MKTELDNEINFKAWTDIEPSPAFEQDVMRRIRTASPEQTPSWLGVVRVWLSGRVAYAGTLAAASVVAAIMLTMPVEHTRRDPMQAFGVANLPSLTLAYAEVAKGN